MIQLHSLTLNPRSKPAIRVQEIQNGVLLKDKLWIVQLYPVNAGEAHRFIVYVDTEDKERAKKADLQLMQIALEYLKSYGNFRKMLEEFYVNANREIEKDSRSR